MRRPMLARAVSLLSAALLISVAPAPSALADSSVPYKDPNAIGGITLCDTDGTPLTGGNIADAPFVWRAVGSAPAPKAYVGDGRTAVLYGYQPLQGVAPSQWSGEYLTASAKYTNPKFPMAAATPADRALTDYLSDLPPKWNGLVQLRMFVSAPDEPTYTQTYNAATIAINGNTWSLVQGGGGSCTSGKSTSSELSLLPSVAAMPTPTPRHLEDAKGTGSTGATNPATAPGGHDATAGKSASKGGQSSTNSAATSGNAGSSGAGAQSHASSSAASSKSSSGATLWVVVLIVVVVVAGAAGAYLWRRRAATSR